MLGPVVEPDGRSQGLGALLQYHDSIRALAHPKAHAACCNECCAPTGSRWAHGSVEGSPAAEG
eukprot:CAMPEP_0119401280 /NCGR_PEP_ID=MMETSP1334-20130426/142291_1 /TAXON_ID=127549 /ORGANISM="Calcidiscus leptoporus, Strain RCC1130" /LENGTH=62 /DNA_ID=CAMNT_0007425195 /DNA_START=1037 /DNA_END=1225 /DNA_ORIENTATION=+